MARLNAHRISIIPKQAPESDEPSTHPQHPLTVSNLDEMLEVVEQRPREFFDNLHLLRNEYIKVLDDYNETLNKAEDLMSAHAGLAKERRLSIWEKDVIIRHLKSDMADLRNENSGLQARLNQQNPPRPPSDHNSHDFDRFSSDSSDNEGVLLKLSETKFKSSEIPDPPAFPNGIEPGHNPNARKQFRALTQGGKSFDAFWAEFQRLSIELSRDDETLIEDLASKVSPELRKALTGQGRSKDLYKYAEQCSQAYQDLKDNESASVVIAASRESRPAQPAIKSSTTPKSATRGCSATPQNLSLTLAPAHSLSQTDKSRLFQEGRCYKCKNKGHAARTCTGNWTPISAIADIAEVSRVESLSSEPQTTVESAQRLSETNRSRLSEEGRCFKCKQKGHAARDCTGDWTPISAIADIAEVSRVESLSSEPQTTVESAQRLSESDKSRLSEEGRCYKCKNKGHAAATCTGDWTSISAVADVSRVESLSSDPQTTLESAHRLSHTDKSRLCEEGRCFKCKQKGHAVRSCTGDWTPINVITEVSHVDSSSSDPQTTVESAQRLSKSDKSRLSQEDRCFKCKTIGHRAANCMGGWTPMSALAVVNSADSTSSDSKK